MTQRKAVGAVAAAAAVGVTAAAYLLSGRADAPPALTPREAREAATQSCRQLAVFQQLVRANAASDQVRAALARSVSLAKSAATSDPTWIALAGGAESVQVALAADDARAARVGIDVVRAECRKVPARS